MRRELSLIDLRASLVAIGALALGACTSNVSLGSDYTHVYPDGATRVRCGTGDCDPGKVCCSEACGTCAAPGECPAPPTSCADASTPCGPDHVALTGVSTCSWFVWNGVDCYEAQGCACAGDCTLPQPTYVACMQLHATCWPQVCSASVFCPTHFFCERATCAPAATGACRAVPTDCSSVPHTAVCGCDQIDYDSSCAAARANQSAAPAPATCGVCNAPDVTPTPGCTTSLGWSWDGRTCVEQVGCSCVGDCTRLEPTQASCLARYQAACEPMFPCASRSCVRHLEICSETSMGSYCAPPSTPACTMTPTCACLIAAGVTTTARCTDDGDGRVSVVEGP